MLAGSAADTLIFSQELHHGPDPTWWYLAPECGQHISFYSTRTLEAIGHQLGMRLESAQNLHLLTRSDLSRGGFARALHSSWFRRRQILKRLRSLTQGDAERAASDLDL